MSAADEQPPRRYIPQRRRTRAAIALVVLLLAALAIAWLARIRIATGVIDRKLAAAGVPARYTVSDLGFGRQRLTDVVMGDPANPDLTADWIETITYVGLNGASVTGVRAGRVRLRGRLVDGRVSLGTLDRLLPAPSGKPFALPALDVQVADGGMRLATPYGPVALTLAGQGRLNDGFRGRLGAAAPRLAIGDCTVRGLTAATRVSIDRAAPTLTGPVGAKAIACAGTSARDLRARIDATLSPALDRWKGEAQLATAAIVSGDTTLAQARGTIGFDGSATGTRGPVDLTARDVENAGVRAGTAAIDGQWRVTPGRFVLAGRTRAADVALPARDLRAIRAEGAGAANTPVAPLLARAGNAAAAALSRFDLDADIAIATGEALAASIDRAALHSASGARATFAGGTLAFGDPRGPRLSGRLQIAGGGLPEGSIALAQSVPGGPIDGTATVVPYAAGDARLALTPVHFSTADDRLTRIDTIATLSGPLGNGRVDGLRLPVVAAWNGAGALTVNASCQPLAFDRLAISGLVLDAARVPLCPAGAAMVRVAEGQVDGGVRLGIARLRGRIGSTPLTLAAQSGTVRVSDGGFAVTGVETRLGSPERVTRLDIGTLTGRIAGGSVEGTFAGAGGQIGNVPLLLSDAAGDWRLRGGTLDLTGALTVADAAEDPRFKAMPARDVALRLAGDRITATGVLTAPDDGPKVADIRIEHALSTGRGAAHLAVPGLTFGDGFQPDQLTRLTFGVVADVKGTVTGDADIAWSPDGVTSTGTFTTPDTDLAAAFGPVEGLATTVRFSDLLNLESAPGQIATVKSINPGIEVTDGRIAYRLLPDLRVGVEGGRWPFAGGTLSLRPSVLDFGAEQERRLTFDVMAMDAAQFLQKFDFDNIDATGTFNGTLPMVFGGLGGRIEDGELNVREGGGTIAYVGELTEKDLGFWGNVAFQSLKSLRYQNLAITMNGPLAGDMVTQVRFAGVGQGEGAKRNFIISRLAKLPFVFNITITAPFRSLIDTAASFYDPNRLIERNLPALIEEQNRRLEQQAQPVQPPASEK